jgi:hypothetical protein
LRLTTNGSDDMLLAEVVKADPEREARVAALVAFYAPHVESTKRSGRGGYQG